MVKILTHLGMRFAYALMRGYWYVVRPVTVGVRVLLVKDEAVLLVKHSYMPRWYLPGGRPKRGETLMDTARREAREEVGALVDEMSLCGIYTGFADRKSDHIAVFRSNSFVLKDVKSSEILEKALFDKDHLPSDTSAEARRIISACHLTNGTYMYETGTA